jgi:hypothetical protein
MKILNSASKLVFVLMALSVVALTVTGTVEGKDFMLLTSMAFTFYFTKSIPNTIE